MNSMIGLHVELEKREKTEVFTLLTERKNVKSFEKYIPLQRICASYPCEWKILLRSYSG